MRGYFFASLVMFIMELFLISLMGCSGYPFIKEAVYTPKNLDKYHQKLEEYFGKKFSVDSLFFMAIDKEEIEKICHKGGIVGCATEDGYIYIDTPKKDDCYLEMHELTHWAVFMTKGTIDPNHNDPAFKDTLEMCFQMGLIKSN